jgi:hypothetical protein
MFTPSNGTYDAQMTSDMRQTTNAVVGWLLMASWCYYIEPNPGNLLSDTQFDKACKWLERHYAVVSHKYKYLLPLEGLAAGSAYNLRSEQYPLGIVRLAQRAKSVLEGV